jgi:hypothetical protein
MGASDVNFAKNAAGITQLSRRLPQNVLKPQ